jgi:hypothetical protein
VWREFSLAEDRRRRNRPETLRHKYFGLSRSLESGRADHGDDPPKGSSVRANARSLRS